MTSLSILAMANSQVACIKNIPMLQPTSTLILNLKFTPFVEKCSCELAHLAEELSVNIHLKGVCSTGFQDLNVADLEVESMCIGEL